MAAPATGCGSKRGPAVSSKEDRGTYKDRRGAHRFSKGRDERLGFTRVYSKAYNKTDDLSHGSRKAWAGMAVHISGWSGKPGGIKPWTCPAGNRGEMAKLAAPTLP